MNALVVQCGGPTPVFTASLAAVIGGCQQERAFRQLWGARLGLQGLVAGDWVDLTHLHATSMDRLRDQPGALPSLPPLPVNLK
jgi:6-phosphofructokinase